MDNNARSSVLPLITTDIFMEVERVYLEEGKLTDDTLLALHSVFGAPFERALEMLEKDCVTLLTTPNNSRQALQVSGRAGELYTLFPHINYCPCSAYRHQVASSRTHVTCKHVLAARLAQITGQAHRKEASPQDVARILCAAAHADVQQGGIPIVT